MVFFVAGVAMFASFFFRGFAVSTKEKSRRNERIPYPSLPISLSPSLLSSSSSFSKKQIHPSIHDPPPPRWLERHNAKLREAGKKDERKRLRAFVELAYEKDPRVQARKEQMKNARAARAAEKAAARNAGAKAEEEARAKAEAEAAAAAAAAAEAAAAAKKLREREKKAAQKARSRLRAAAAAAGAKPGSAIDDEVEALCAALDAAALDRLTEAITAGGSSLENAVAVAAGRVSADKDAEKEARDAARKRAEAEAARAAAAEAEAKARAWTDEEVRLLTRAVGKLPAGTPKRWEAVAAQVRTRTADECVAMVKHGLAAGKFSAAAAGGTFTVPAKRAGNAVIKDAATSRETSFTDVEVKLVGEAAKVLAPSSATAAAAKANGSTSASPSKAAADAAPADAPASSSSPPVSPAPADAPAWTEEQELALVRALKAHGKELGAERWAKVSEAVPGQSAAACLRRFKELKAAVKSTKKEG